MDYIEALSSSYVYPTSNDNQKDEVGKDEFLKMLIAQLQYQDPLNPLDGTDFTAQLAQFSSLEQLTDMNTNLGNLYTNQVISNRVSAVNLIGKEITTLGNTIQIEGTPVTISYNLAEDVTTGAVNIYGLDGELVKTIAFNNQEAGKNSVEWDCQGVADGVYTYEVTAQNGEGDTVTVDALFTGLATGVSFSGETSYVLVDDIKIPFDNVLYVKNNEDN
jgi:flagellar basal-body rod modification protein FlgD